MTYNAQNLNICWISSKGWLSAVRFYVMSLQIICAATLFTVTFFCNNLLNYFSNSISSFGRSIVPFGMVRPTHISTASRSHAGNRTIFSSTTMTFTHLKCFFAFFASTFNKCFWFARFNFFCAWPRTSMRSASYVTIWSSKLYTASCTFKRRMTTSNNFSFGA